MGRIFKSLFRRGEANGIKIFCLGVGLAIGLTLLAEVIFERSYDDFIPRLEDTYRVESNFLGKDNDGWRSYSQTAGAIAPGIKSYCPEVEAATRFTDFMFGVPFRSEDNKVVQGNALMCDSSFFDVFPLPILMGESPRTGLEKPGNVYISKKLLEVLGEGIIGHTLSWQENPKVKFTVVGVFGDLPENSHLPDLNMAIALSSIGWYSWDGRDNWIGNDRYKSYVRLRSGTNPEQLKPNIKKMIDDHVGEELEQAGLKLDYTLYPVKKIFVSSDYNRVMNIVFLAFAVIMLLTAMLNYILLSISSMVNRAKTVATYRCYGAGSKDIYRMILAESFLHVGILSLALAVLIIFGLQDFLQEQIGHSLQSLFPPQTIIICILVTLAVVVVCGVMPGYLYTRIPVTYAYRRYTESKRHWKLGLLFVQFLLTTLFVNLLAVIGLQYHTLTNYDAGFEYKSVAMVGLSNVPMAERERCVQELRRLPNVVSLTWGYQSPADRCSGNNVYLPDTKEQLMNVADMYDVGGDYHKTFQIPLVEGEVFTPHLQDTVTRQVMVSRRFVERMKTLAGWEGSAVGKSFFLSEHGGPLTICGVYEEIHLGSQMTEQRDERPTVMFYGDKPIGRLFIRFRQMSPEAMQEAQAVVDRTMASQDKIVTSLGLEMNSLYVQLLHVRNSVLFAGLCVLIIALIGLMAYIRDEVTRRRSEIAIRIIHGASVADVQRLFLTDLLKIALPAVVVGAMLAWKVGENILQLFAVKIELSWWIFTGCTLIVLLIVVMLAALLVLKAARVNPTENLKTE